MARLGIKSRLALVALAPGLALAAAAGNLVSARLDDRRAAIDVRSLANAMGDVHRLRAALNGETSLTQLVARLPSFGVSIELAGQLMHRDVVGDLAGQRAEVDRELAITGPFGTSVGQTIALARAQYEAGDATPASLRTTYSAASDLVRGELSDRLVEATNAARALAGTSEVQDAIEGVRLASNVAEWGTQQLSELADLTFTTGDARDAELTGLIAAYTRYRASKDRLVQIGALEAANALDRLESLDEVKPFFAVLDAVAAGDLSAVPGAMDFAVLVPTFGGGLAFESGLSAVVLAATDHLARTVDARARAATNDYESALLQLVLVLVGTVAIAAGMAASLARPLRRLADDVRTVRTGDLDHPVSLGSRTTEIHVLQEAVGDLVTTLRTVDLQAQALADGQLDAPVLDERVPGKLGRSLQESVARLSTAMTDERELRERLEHEATHDSLTGLVNRSGALEHLGRMLSSAARHGRATALLFIDLDEFKRVNDNHGHAAGDEVLREVGRRLSALARAGDVVARLGGDEFVAIIEGAESAEAPIAFAERILASLREPISADGDRFVVGGSVGVALATDGELDALAMLEQADVAVFRAKSRGKGRVEVFDAELQRQLEEHAEIEGALTAGIARDELVVHYQPIIAAADRQPRAVEALVRWERPGHGLVPPGVFIPVAEDSDLIIDLGRWVLRRATTELAACCHDDPDHDPLTLTVNVSARHVASGTLLADVLGALEESGLPPERLVVEITETVLVTDLPFLGEQLQQLRDRGVRVAIDDFGTGFTSLAHLRQLPADVIKIDRSFVSELGDAGEGDGSLVRIVIDLGHQLGLEVVAEGVETAPQLDQLRDLGCDRIQGFHVARPMPVEACRAWLADHHAPSGVASGGGEVE